MYYKWINKQAYNKYTDKSLIYRALNKEWRGEKCLSGSEDILRCCWDTGVPPWVTSVWSFCSFLAVKRNRVEGQHSWHGVEDLSAYFEALDWKCASK